MGGDRLNLADVPAIKKKFAFLAEFTDSFIMSHPLETLLKMETTSIKIQEYEKGKAASSKLASNRDSIASTYTQVVQGQDNRWNELHSARFLPGAGCSAGKVWLRAREVLGDKGTVPISTYDMGCVGLAGFVSKRGWCELHQPGSDSISLKMFNINSCAAKSSSSSSSAKQDEEFKDIMELGELKLALRAAREAQSFVFPWNKSIAAIEGFMFRTDFCSADLAGEDKPAAVLTQFVDFALTNNADKWKNQEPFLSAGDLKTLWDSFYGAKPSSKLGKQKQKEPEKKKDHFKTQFTSGVFDDVCRLYNMGRCVKPPGACATKGGIPLRHVCNFTPDPRNPQAICAKPHPRCMNH